MPIHNNASVNAHLEQLNNTISMLRREKVELTAQLRKMQTAAIHLQGRVDQLAKQVLIIIIIFGIIIAIIGFCLHR